MKIKKKLNCSDESFESITSSSSLNEGKISGRRFEPEDAESEDKAGKRKKL